MIFVANYFKVDIFVKWWENLLVISEDELQWSDGDVPPIIQEEYGEEETVAEFSAWEQDLKSVELEFLKTGKSGKSDKPGVLITNSGNYKYQLDRGSIRSSPRYGLSTPYRLLDGSTMFFLTWETCIWSFLHWICLPWMLAFWCNDATSKIDDVLTEHDGLLHVLPLAVHLRFIFLLDK